MPNKGREEPGGKHSGHHIYPEAAKSDGGKIHPHNKGFEKNSRADAVTPAGKNETGANGPVTERQWK